MPTTRFAALLAAGALLALAAPAVPGAGRAVLALDAAAALAWLVDRLRTPGPGSVEAARRVREPLSAFAPNAVEVEVASRAPRALDLEVADSPPAAFEARGHRARLRLASGGRAHLAYRATPRERGRFAFGDLHVRAAGPWGLAARQWRIPLGREVAVYPDLRTLAPGAGAGPGGPGAAARHGLSEGREFEALRPYLPGDDVRTVDWKATARRGAPVVRELVPERDQTMWLLLDCGRHLASRLADGRSKLDCAVDAALALARAAALRGDRVGALLFGAEAERLVAPARGSARLGPLAEALSLARARVEEPDYAAAFDALQARQVRRALVVVFTDLGDADASEVLLRRAVALRSRHLTWVVAVADSAVADAARALPRTEAQAYARLAAERILAERERSVAHLAAAGVRVLSVPAAELRAAVVEGYLDVKRRGRL
ncbi:MAG TPA: DUF58 domain-containing protein [Anaeromyxobacteraceae bacterium]